MARVRPTVAPGATPTLAPAPLSLAASRIQPMVSAGRNSWLPAPITGPRHVVRNMDSGEFHYSLYFFLLLL